MGWRGDTWTEERVERLRVLWFGGSGHRVRHADGLHSQCRDRCGPPPRLEPDTAAAEAATSKAMRLAGPTLAPEEALPEPAAQLLTIPEQVSKPDPPIGSFGLMDLRYGVCKWPEGDAPPFAYCGDTALENGPYCDDHHGGRIRARSTAPCALSRATRSGRAGRAA